MQIRPPIVGATVKLIAPVGSSCVCWDWLGSYVWLGRVVLHGEGGFVALVVDFSPSRDVIALPVHVQTFFFRS